MNSYESAVGQLLVRKVSEVITDKIAAMEAGNFINTSDVNATAITYIQHVECIRTLRLALDICKQIEADLRKG